MSTFHTTFSTTDTSTRIETYATTNMSTIETAHVSTITSTHRATYQQSNSSSYHKNGQSSWISIRSTIESTDTIAECSTIGTTNQSSKSTTIQSTYV